MATWHQQQRPAKLYHETKWTIVTNPPGDMCTLWLESSEQQAKDRLALWASNGRDIRHSYILPPSKIDVPNLDAMARLECFRFWSDNHMGRRNRAARFFPDKPRGYVRALRDLCNYASNKSAAMLCRERGDIAGAQIYESICERIYSGLPPFARW
jgi:hypothetical protein